MLRKSLSALAISSFIILSCGADQPSIVKSFSYNIQNNIVSFQVEFSQNIELNTEFNIPILDYGSFLLTPPASGNGFIIGGTLNLDYINDERLATLSKTRLLPNAQAMSTYVTEDVARIRIKDTDQIYSDVYLGMDNQHMYLGTALELEYIDQNFPAGLVVSGRISDAKKNTVGVITVFGPNVQNGHMISPGGIFFITNVSDLIKYNPTGATIRPAAIHDTRDFKDTVEINAPYRREYSDPFKLYKLLEDMRKAGEEAGYIDKRR